MRSLVPPAVVALALALVCAPLAIALTGKAQYSGKTSDSSTVRLRLSANGKLVSKLRIFYKVDCNDGASGTTYTDVQNLHIAKKGKFAGHGSYTGSSDGSQNTFRISGTITGKKAAGTFSLTAGGTNKQTGAPISCQTGTLSFTAQRVS